MEWNESVRGPMMSNASGNVIYKYQIPILEDFTLNLPKGAKVIRVDHIEGMSWLWAIINTKVPDEKRQFRAFKTGAEMGDISNLSYLGFCPVYVQMELGLYIFEVVS